MKQKDVATALGVSPQDFNNWMFREIFPHYDKLEKLAEILDVDVFSLHREQMVMDPIAEYGTSNRIKTDSFIPYFEPNLEFDLVHFDLEKKSGTPKDMLYTPGVKADLFYPYFGKDLFSMSNGDLVALERIEDFSFIDLNKTYAICTKQQVIYRLLKLGKNEGSFLAYASEDDDTPQQISKKDIRALFSVKALLKRSI